MEEINKNFQNGIDAITDLSLLSESSVLPIINRIEHSIYQIKRLAQKDVSSGKFFCNVSSFLHNTVKTLAKKFISNQKNVKQGFIQIDLENIDIFCWDRVLGVSNLFFNVCEKFQFMDGLDVKITEGGLSVVGVVENSDEILKFRSLIYHITKSLLQQNCVLTYSLVGDCLTLEVDYSYDEGSVYLLNLSEKKSLLLGLPNNLEKFKRSKEDITHLGEHLCIEIDENLGVKKYSKIPDHIYQKNSDSSVLHFCFLFRQLSLIIPKEGQVVSLEFLDNMIHTGCGNDGNQDDGKKIHFTNIDIFQLFS